MECPFNAEELHSAANVLQNWTNIHVQRDQCFVLSVREISILMEIVEVIVFVFFS